ncbi:TetR/AcrR family transcriptional regulator [Fusobacterium simiae]|uniref:TetR/AcrR family transcriptional regulator n=1 Tax=Fusobacterium simiae TaxID=855 RepID=A0ABT4DHJ2_FUSSI|nr:TetR/AcrR family transcriptional regulator [Fusobacterium simiae]MCY7008068.1 TetR/AcrR family transcriptional regulator [Fusobacterium simiae]
MTENAEKKDLRVIKTIRIIKETFKNLILEKNYEKITIKELTDRAEINKKTFYRYYNSLDDLLLETQNEFSKEYIESVKMYELPNDLEKINREFYLFSKKHGEFFEKITCDINYNYIRQKMINNVMNSTWEYSEKLKNLSEYEKNILFSYIQAASISIYKQWVKDKKKISLDKIIELSNNLLCRGVFSLFKKS